MALRIVLRDDSRLVDEAYLLVRANTDVNKVMSLRNALRQAPHYAEVAAFAPHGAVMLSTYLAPTEEAAETLIATTRWEWFGTAQLRVVRERGFEVFATSSEVYDETTRLWVPEDPQQSEHVDVLIGRYPADQPPYDKLPTKAATAALRSGFETRFNLAISIFNPRRKLSSAPDADQ